MYEMKFEDFGEGIHEGILVKWEVNPMDYVKVGQILFQLETEKVTLDITSPVSGQVVKLHFLKGERIFSGNTLLVIQDELQNHSPD